MDSGRRVRMDAVSLAKKALTEDLEARFLIEDEDSWIQCLKSIESASYVPLQYKPSFLRYQEAYFKDVFECYEDTSVVLYRGGRPVGIWPVCIYEKDGELTLGTAGSALIEPLLPGLPKAEAQRSVIEKCLSASESAVRTGGGNKLYFSMTSLDQGGSQWTRKIMERGARQTSVRWQAFADLSLPHDVLQSKIRRTNKYSVAKGHDEYNVEIIDESSDHIEEAFDEYHKMHALVSGRETRNQATWDLQRNAIENGCSDIGKSFLVLIRDKASDCLAGAALFDATPQTGLYCSAAYDRERFGKPVGHVVQAIAMDYMRRNGVRWYELGERPYPSDEGVSEKLINIGHYKEGFATHLFPRIFAELSVQIQNDN